MSLRTVFFLVFLLPGGVFADAGNGEFMGYQLGTEYRHSASTQSRVTTNGNLSVRADDPVKPANISNVTLIVTPESKTIGFIDASSTFATEADAREFGKTYVGLLHAKYPDWSFGRERLNADMLIDEVNFDKPPFNIKMRLSPSNKGGKQQWRLSMTLRWLEGTKELKAWQNISTSEQNYREDKDRRKLLEGADTRGL